MKDRKLSCRINDINKLRAELHQLLESEIMTSSTVLKRSRELDSLIMLYYTKKDHDLNKP